VIKMIDIILFIVFLSIAAWLIYTRWKERETVEAEAKGAEEERMVKVPALSPLIAKLPSWKNTAGTLVTLVIIGLVALYLMGCLYQKVEDRKLIVSDASLGQQMDGWEGEGVKIRGEEFLLLPGASMTKEYKKGTMVTVALVNIEGEGKIGISIEDLYDYSSNPEKNLGYVFRRDAKFTFTVTEKGITSSNVVEFGNSMTPVKLVWNKNEVFKGLKGQEGFISVAVGEKELGSYYGTGGNFSSYLWKICPIGYQSRGIKRPFRITIRNLGGNDKGISINDIVVRKEPL